MKSAWYCLPSVVVTWMVWFLSVSTADLTLPCSISWTTFPVSACCGPLPVLAQPNVIVMTSTARSTRSSGPRKIRFNSIASDPFGPGPFPPDQPHVPPTTGGTACLSPGRLRRPCPNHDDSLTVHQRYLERHVFPTAPGRAPHRARTGGRPPADN